MNNATLAAAVLAVVVVAGCTSSSKPPAGPVSSSTSVVSTPPASSSSPAPSPTATKPLSPFEADPAVMALRAWADEAARTVNTGNYDSRALNELMTPSFAKTMNFILGDDVGLRYPGPIPFQPIGVTVRDSAHRTVKVCDVVQGFARKPTTGKPAHTLQVVPVEAPMVLSKGRWVLDDLRSDPSISCSGVRVTRPIW